MNGTQLNINFYAPPAVNVATNVERPQNNAESQVTVVVMEKKLNKQCALILELMKSGVKLTTRTAMLNHGIGHLQRRVKDLKDIYGVAVKADFVTGENFKEYYL